MYFSPIHDTKLPEGVDAVYIGGGFPEIYAEELSLNTQMLDSVKDFYDGYGVIYAECGGLMYLMEQLEYKHSQGLRGHAALPDKGDRFRMCGVIKGLARMVNRRVVNYVEGELQKDCIIGKKGSRFKGHEFHHSEIIVDADVDFAYKMLRGDGIKNGMDGIVTKNCLASFAHLHAASYTEFAKNFVRNATKNKVNT